MVQDVLGSLTAVLAFAVVLYAPGYLAAYATNVFFFRERNFTDRSLWAIALSLCVAPIVAHLIGRVAGLPGVCWTFDASGLATLILIGQRRNHASWPLRDRRITALFAVGWTAAVLLLLVDAQVGHKLYFSVVMADQSYRIAFTDAVARTGIPPANPLYFAGSPAPMRYFYFWYVLCATVMRLAHVSARQAFVASTVWAGFGLLATVQLYGKHFFCWPRKQRWIALGLLAVNGADLVPALGQAFLQPTLNGNTEWWSVDPIFAWPDSLLWVPHHVASVLCCLLGFLFLWRTTENSSVRTTPLPSRPEPGRLPAALTTEAQRSGETRVGQPLAADLPKAPASQLAPILFASAALASAFGLSVYVAFGFAVLMVAWLLRLWMLDHPQRRELTKRIALATVFSVVISVPFLHELASGVAYPVHSAATSTAQGTRLFSLSVRRMIDSELLTGLPVFAHLNQTHPILLDQTIRLALLPPGLAMELGVYGAVLVLLLLARRRVPSSRRHDAHNTALFFALCGLGITLFLSSSVITNNDFGYRAVMLPQFFLLLLTAELLGCWRLGTVPQLIQPTPAKRGLVHGLLILGIAGTFYWAFLLRAWLPIEAARPQPVVQPGFSASPDDEFQIRRVFETLDRVAPRNAVVAFRPIDAVPDRRGAVMVPNEYYQRMLVMDAGRQMLNAEAKCATHFGGDPRPCPLIQAATALLYARPLPSADEARGYCSRFGVTYLVFSAWDPGWTARDGWPATLPIVAQQERIRIFQCA